MEEKNHVVCVLLLMRHIWWHWLCITELKKKKNVSNYCITTHFFRLVMIQKWVTYEGGQLTNQPYAIWRYGKLIIMEVQTRAPAYRITTKAKNLSRFFVLNSFVFFFSLVKTKLKKIEIALREKKEPIT